MNSLFVLIIKLKKTVQNYKIKIYKTVKTWKRKINDKIIIIVVVIVFTFGSPNLSPNTIKETNNLLKYQPTVIERALQSENSVYSDSNLNKTIFVNHKSTTNQDKLKKQKNLQFTNSESMDSMIKELDKTTKKEPDNKSSKTNKRNITVLTEIKKEFLRSLFYKSDEDFNASKKKLEKKCRETIKNRGMNSKLMQKREIFLALEDWKVHHQPKSGETMEDLIKSNAEEKLKKL